MVPGVALPRLDAVTVLPVGLTGYLFGGGADAARSVLGTIAGSLITVTALTFSLTVVTLQLASSQFSPRLLRTFTRDRVVHLTLALFLATFTFAVVVLRTVRSAASGRAESVPEASVTVAVLLTLASVIGLVLFLSHLAATIRVETMLVTVHTDAEAAAPGALGPRGVTGPALEPPADAVVVLARQSGFLLDVNAETLLAAVSGQQACLRVDRVPGDWVVAGTPLGLAWRLDGGLIGRDALQELQACVDATVSVGGERTLHQDVAFGLRQLTDVAIKALSPGVNDPTTAVHALGHSATLLCGLAGGQLGPRRLVDADGRVRVELRRASLTTSSGSPSTSRAGTERAIPTSSPDSWHCSPTSPGRPTRSKPSRACGGSWPDCGKPSRPGPTSTRTTEIGCRKGPSRWSGRCGASGCADQPDRSRVARTGRGAAQAAIPWSRDAAQGCQVDGPASPHPAGAHVQPGRRQHVRAVRAPSRAKSAARNACRSCVAATSATGVASAAVGRAAFWANRCSG